MATIGAFPFLIKADYSKLAGFSIAAGLLSYLFAVGLAEDAKQIKKQERKCVKKLKKFDEDIKRFLLLHPSLLNKSKLNEE